MLRETAAMPEGKADANSSQTLNFDFVLHFERHLGFCRARS
jgi:hypothetical protein